jgi:uncharacterized protein GlcG (DUF336 family)
MLKHLLRQSCGVLLGTFLISGAAFAENQRDRDSNCKDLPTHAELKAALNAAQNQPNGGFNLEMWATVVNRDGEVCAVAFTGNHRGDQWPGSRVISAQKANTANAFSLPGLSLSTANLFSAVQPGGSLFGLQESNPVDTSVAYKGNSANYGQANDPMNGEKIGGVNVFGGGLALYAKQDGQRCSGWGDRCQRRQFMCGPQHCMENPEQPSAGLCARWRFRCSDSSRQHRL